MKPQEFNQKLTKLEAVLSSARSHFDRGSKEGLDQNLKLAQSAFDDLMAAPVEFGATYRVVIMVLPKDTTNLASLLVDRLHMSAMEVRPFLESLPSFAGMNMTLIDANELAAEIEAMGAKAAVELE